MPTQRVTEAEEMTEKLLWALVGMYMFGVVLTLAFMMGTVA